jgi:hypothetical protein
MKEKSELQKQMAEMEETIKSKIAEKSAPLAEDLTVHLLKLKTQVAEISNENNLLKAEL